MSDIICITGAAPRQLDNVAAILRSAGMTAPAPAARDKQLNLARWHQQVLAAEKGTQPHAQLSPGRLWEQLAGDVFVANLQADLWGWADSRSTWLLDFWLNFEPNIKFVLVCVSPQQMLADCLAENPDPDNNNLVEKTIRLWLVQHQEMLRFHNRHPQRSLLVMADDCMADPDALLAQCQDKWQLPLNPLQSPFNAAPATDAMFSFLAEQLCRDFPELESLNHELAATITRFGPEETPASLSLAQAIAHYQQLQQQLEQQRSEHSKQETEYRSRVKQLESERDTLNKQTNEQQAQVQQLSTKLVTTSQQLETARSEQEKAKSELETAKSGLEKAQRDLQASKSQLETSKTALESAQKQHNTLTSGKSAAEQARHSAEQQLKNAEDKLRDSTEENELLLLQLHQVQEELEHYFLRHQEAQQKLKLAEDKWQQMMRRNPDYYEYESLELRSADNADQAMPRWCFTDLHVAGRSFAQLELATVLEQGITGLVFSREPEPAGALLRWPLVADEQDQLSVIPVAQEHNRQQRVETLFDLAASDWQLMTALAGVMAKELGNSQSPAQQYFASHQSAQLAPVQAGLGRFREILDAFPATFRFDSLSLKHEQVNPGYEHLWLRCENASYGSQHWPVFEFRLACANVTPDSFGNDPKLEFPQANDASPLSGWFAESQDNFGAKLELRFALPDAMDVEVWKRLPLADQQFIAALMNRLPAMLQTLQQLQPSLQRPWAQWITMSRDMARIFTQQTIPAEARGQRAAAQGEGVQ